MTLEKLATRMSRNNQKNIDKHNSKLHKAQLKEKEAVAQRKERLAAIIKKYNESKSS